MSCSVHSCFSRSRNGRHSGVTAKIQWRLLVDELVQAPAAEMGVERLVEEAVGAHDVVVMLALTRVLGMLVVHRGSKGRGRKAPSHPID